MHSHTTMNPFIDKNNAITTKGAPSYSIGVADPRTVLFVKALRGMHCATSYDSETGFLEFLLEECWKLSPIDTLRIIFNIRDCRIDKEGTGGKGEKAIFYASIWWLMHNHPDELKHNIHHIPFYGSWRDMLVIFCDTPFEKDMLKRWAAQLHTDVKLIENNHPREIDMSSAKYAPNQNSSFDRKIGKNGKKIGIAGKLCSALGKNINLEQYRKKFLRPLRSAWSVTKADIEEKITNTIIEQNSTVEQKTSGMTIVEERMCAKEWDQIDFSKVPSRALKQYTNAFTRHAPERMKAFLEAVRNGKSKMNVNQLQPHELVKSAEQARNSENVESINVAWNQYLKNMKEHPSRMFSENNKVGEAKKKVYTLPIIDLSGSMARGTGNIAPMHGAIALGLMISLLEPEDSPFHRKWINFSDKPFIQKLNGAELVDMMRNMDRDNWSGTTNYIAAFKLALETVNDVLRQYTDKVDERPVIRFVVGSDMQFDTSVPRETNWDSMNVLADEYGVKYEIVFWNFNSQSLDLPIPHDTIKGVTMLAGFSSAYMNNLMIGKIPDAITMMRSIIDTPRYSRITLPVK